MSETDRPDVLLDQCNERLIAVCAERDELKRYLAIAKEETSRLESEVNAYREELARSFAFNSERESTIVELQQRLYRVQRVSGDGRAGLEIERDAARTSVGSERRRATISEINDRLRAIVAQGRTESVDDRYGDS